MEVASGLNDQRPQFSKLLQDTNIGVILVEHRDRATRFGFNYISPLLQAQERRRAEQIRHCVETTYGLADAGADENESPRQSV